jgi:hypothetical protein
VTPRRRAKKDRNHDHFRDTLRGLGFRWDDTHQLGDGKPDGVCSRWGVSLWVEVKFPGGMLTEDESKFWTDYKADGGAGCIAYWVRDVLAEFLRHDRIELHHGEQLRRWIDRLSQTEWKVYEELK